MQIQQFTASYAKLTTAQKPEITKSTTELFILRTVEWSSLARSFPSLFLSCACDGSQRYAINRPKGRNEALANESKFNYSHSSNT